MSEVFYTSDLHFGHEKLAELRGYSSVEEHDADIMEAWNWAVTTRDHVWILGDLSAGNELDWWRPLVNLPGTKHLVCGNHDSAWAGNRKGYKSRGGPYNLYNEFASVQDFAVRKIGDTRVMLSHFPYSGDRGEDRFTQFRLRDEGRPILHGHTHSTEKVSYSTGWNTVDWQPMETLQVHVGWDAWRRPVSTSEIANVLKGIY